MLRINTLTLGDYQTNCYIIREASSPTCCVIDPGYRPERVLEQARALGLEVEAILLTHGHFDHVGGVASIAADTDCRVFLHPGDLSLPPMLTSGRIPYTDTYGEGQTLRLAGLDIEVLSTPGHTPGSVCLLTEDALFSGDTLFAGSCGRTDLPGGNSGQMRSSLGRLARLVGDYSVFPGHGPRSTLARERESNPYLQGFC